MDAHFKKKNNNNTKETIMQPKKLNCFKQTGKMHVFMMPPVSNCKFRLISKIICKICVLGLITSDFYILICCVLCEIRYGKMIFSGIV